jgi:RNA polymerase sigma-70 factor (ECF subfamily)
MIALAPLHDDATLDADTERMIRVAAGDSRAFDELVRRHFASTVRIISAMMGSSSQSEDLAQDVFLRIYRSRKRYLPTAKFCTWLGTIIRNVVLNAKRTLARRRIQSIGWGDDRRCEDRGAGGGEVDPPAATADPAEQFDRREVVQAVSLAIDALPPRQRRAVELVYLRGMTYVAAADEMGTSWKAVKSLLGRGRGALAVSLKDEYARRFDPAG